MSLSVRDTCGSEHSQYWSNAGFREKLREQPPSAKFIAKVLASGAHLSQDVIIDETLLPRRTVSYALKRLNEAGLVTSRRHVSDPRKHVYELSYTPDE
jgi:DNA-binding transcriptional ArsR family regulator